MFIKPIEFRRIGMKKGGLSILFEISIDLSSKWVGNFGPYTRLYLRATLFLALNLYRRGGRLLLPLLLP